jgi:hypothetical protein
MRDVRRWLLNVMALTLLATSVVAASFTAESKTTIRSFERTTGVATTTQVLPIYESVILDVEHLGSDYLSLHMFGWGRIDALDSGYYDEQVKGELIYGYLEYADGFQRRSLRVGRQHIFEGVANESIDGLRLTSDLGNQLSMSVFGGLPVGLEETEGRSGDSIWGGRFSHHFGAFSDIGVSYRTMANDGTTASSLLGYDSTFFLPMNISLYGTSVRNLETDGWSEHAYGLRVDMESVSIDANYELFDYADYFDVGPTTVGPFLFLASTDEQLTTIGADLSWSRSENWTFSAGAKGYSYEIKDSSRYLSASAIWSGENAAQVGGEIGLMQGNAADNEYVMMRMFCYLDELADKVLVDFISGDVLYTLYDQNIYGKDYAYFLSLGSGKTFLNDNLEVALSADYSADPYYDSQFRSMLTTTYRFGGGS